MVLSESQRKLLAERLKTGAEEVFGNADERAAMVKAMRSGQSPMDTAGGEKLKNLAMGLIFAGPGAKTADLLKLNIAKRMEQAGAKADDIFRNTGWFKGMEGKWKYEIPDNTSRFSQGPLMGGPKQAPEVLDHPDLYAAYPHLRNTMVEPMPSGSPTGAVGSFAGPSFPGGGTVQLGKNARRDTMLHEMQHAVQEKEGFAVGGSPVGNSASMDEAAMMDMYRRLAGEIESRNVQGRMMMTPQMRLNRLPWQTQDIEPNLAIVRTSGESRSMSMPRLDFPKNRQQIGSISKAIRQEFDKKGIEYKHDGSSNTGSEYLYLKLEDAAKHGLPDAKDTIAKHPEWSDLFDYKIRIADHGKGLADFDINPFNANDSAKELVKILRGTPPEKAIIR